MAGGVPGYGTDRVAQLAGLSPARVRALVKDGVIVPARGPRRAYRFTVADLVVLRAARAVVGEVSPRALRRALRRLRAQLPAGDSLAGLRLLSDRGRVVARDVRSAWQPDTGQQLLFTGEEARPRPPARVAPFRRRTRAATSRAAGPAAEGRARAGAATVEDWFSLACDLEARAPAEAAAAYRRALELEPGHAAARLNLGRLLHEHGDVAGAAAEYAAVLDVDPHDAAAAFNLGVALEDLGDGAAAVAAYRRALRLDPRHADAHFNLARLLERDGDRPGALRHLSAYRRLRRPR